VVYHAKPLLQFITLRIRDYLEPDSIFDRPLELPDGTVVDFSERKVQSWLYENRGEEIAESRRVWLDAILPKTKEAATQSPGTRCPVCGLPLLLNVNTDQWSYCAVCTGDVLWEWWAMREQVERAFGAVPAFLEPHRNGG